MGDYLNQLLSEDSSMFLYTTLFVLSALFAKMAQPTRFLGTTKINKFWFLLSFLLLCFFLAFADVGTDTEWYIEFFINKRTFSECGYGPVEIGFQYYAAFLHLFTNNPTIYLIISRVIMVSLVYLSIYNLRDKCVMWLAVLGFTSVVYFQMFSALRNGLAYSLGFLVYALCEKNKYWFALLLAIIGISIHRSMAIYTFTIFAYIIIIKSSPKLLKRIAIPILSLLFFIVFFWGGAIMNYILTSDDVLMGKYSSYLEGTESQGAMVFFIYLPLAYVFINFKSGKLLDDNYFYLNSYLSVIGFTFALLAYQMGQLTRVAPFFALPFLFYIGYYIQNIPHNIYYYKKFDITVTLLVLYWFYRFTLFISGLYYSNGLYDYHFFKIL